MHFEIALTFGSLTVSVSLALDTGGIYLRWKAHQLSEDPEPRFQPDPELVALRRPEVPLGRIHSRPMGA